MGYSDPQPRELVEERYLENYDLAEFFGPLEARKGVLNERRLDNLPEPQAGQTLLDVGCGDGQFASAAMARGWTVKGVELNPPAAQKARERGVTVLEGHLEEIDLDANSFDLVTSWDVIEHVPEPDRFVRKLVDAVSADGTIVVTTLNRHALVSRAFRGRWSMVVEDHFTYWDRASLTRAFSDAGATVTESRSYGLGRDFVAWIDRWRGSADHRADVDKKSPDAAEDSVSKGSRWDVNPAVLGTEQALNRFLDRTSLGVEIEVTVRAPAD